ncbi:hypothetical protein [Clostridium sp. CCUG 7971]|uniref:hypothetical protein n=1 Tax=Clostridium sp. CCUG 7971 TaxID=2811414 RepID=UPI001ABBE0CF|nr:hypothetical protein [Clostridium sp. CCUG 7971]MBO3443348.1 hypothetical protein [Clostridium sp. CCUG 7971]
MNKDYWYYYFENYYRWMNSYLNLLILSGHTSKNFFEKYISDASQFAPPVSDKVYIDRMFGDDLDDDNDLDDNNGNWNNNNTQPNNSQWNNNYNNTQPGNSQWDNNNNNTQPDNSQWNNNNNSTQPDNSQWNNNNNNTQPDNSQWNNSVAENYGFGAFENVSDTQLNLTTQQGLVADTTSIFDQCKCYQILKVEARKNNNTIRFMFIPKSITANGFNGYILSCNGQGLNLRNITIPFSAIVRISCVSL